MCNLVQPKMTKMMLLVELFCLLGGGFSMLYSHFCLRWSLFSQV